MIKKRLFIKLCNFLASKGPVSIQDNKNCDKNAEYFKQCNILRQQLISKYQYKIHSIYITISLKTIDKYNNISLNRYLLKREEKITKK
jgi:hypothetical protein